VKLVVATHVDTEEPGLMSRARVGDRELVVERRSAGPEEERLLTRVGAALGSPVGVLFVVPGLVFVVGALLTLIGQESLQNSALALGREQFAARNAAVSRQIGLALAQSDILLERLRSLSVVHSPERPFDATAFSMRDMMQGRHGVAYVSLSFPDGTFQGAYVHDDGSIRFQDSRIDASGTRVRRYSTEGRDRLVQLSEERSQYDPRTREFYTLALGSEGAVWTKPYPFFGTHYTGVTRTLAARAPDSALRAVLTVDFDVNELSHYLERMPLYGARVVLSGRDGTLLADPSAAARIHALPVSSTRALDYRDLKDPVLSAFFQQRADPLSFDLNGERYLARTSPVGDPSLGWSVGSFVPESVFFEAARAYQRRAAALALVCLGIAVLVAVAFSRHIVRIRKQTAAARAEASRAAEAAKDLGSYRLTTRIGKGGMGEVWCAEHRLLAREAAIKLIGGEAAPNAEAQERFRREAQTLAALRSRNTIELFDYGITDEGTCFYVMELLDGMDLETLLQRFGPQPPARVRAFLIQALNSLAEAHGVGLVHRDIKPANLYACRAADEVDVIKVLDFGLVRSLSDRQLRSETLSFEELSRMLESGEASLEKLTIAGSVMGTPDYMSPEQILGLDTDGRTDLYALGCAAYSLLSGELPFPSKKDGMLTMLAHLQAEPRPLASVMKGDCPEALSELVMRCLAKAPADRPGSARELARELLQIRFAPEEEWTPERAASWWEGNVPRRASLRPASGGLLAPRGAP
jgi:serine/threonine protein kinase